MPRNQNRIGRMEYIRLNDKLREVLVKVDDTTCNFIEGWDDARVARELQLSIVAVQGLRREAFGNLPRGDLGVYATTRKEIEELQKVVAHQATELQRQHTLINELILKHNNLSAELAMNRVLSTARHHEVKLPPRANGAQA